MTPEQAKLIWEYDTYFSPPEKSAIRRAGFYMDTLEYLKMLRDEIFCEMDEFKQSLQNQDLSSDEIEDRLYEQYLKVKNNTMNVIDWDFKNNIDAHMYVKKHFANVVLKMLKGFERLCDDKIEKYHYLRNDDLPRKLPGFSR